MAKDSTKLPGSEDENNEEIMELIDKARQENKCLRIESDGFIGGRQYIYVTKLCDLRDERDYDESFVVVKEEGFGPKFVSEQVLHDFMLKQYEAEIINIDEVPTNEENLDPNYRKKMRSWEEKGNPFDEVFVFVKHTEDGRYKDEWKLYRGSSEEEIRETNSLSKPGTEAKYQYTCLGPVRQVVNNTEELSKQYGFDRKKAGGRGMPVDLSAFLEENALSDAVKKVMDSED